MERMHCMLHEVSLESDVKPKYVRLIITGFIQTYEVTGQSGWYQYIFHNIK